MSYYIAGNNEIFQPVGFSNDVTDLLNAPPAFGETASVYVPPPEYQPVENDSTERSRDGIAQPQPEYTFANHAVYVSPVTNEPQAAVLTAGDCEPTGETDNSHLFDSKPVRMGFLQKVYGTLTLQLLAVFLVIALCMFVPDVEINVIIYSWLDIAGSVVLFVLCVVFMCASDVRRHFPLNVVCLFIFTVVEGVTFGSICVYYDVSSLLIAVGICILLAAVQALFALQRCINVAVISSMQVVIVLCFIVIIVLCFVQPFHWKPILIAGLGACIFFIYVVHSSHKMMSAQGFFDTSPDDYIFATLNLYLELITYVIFYLFCKNHRVGIC